MIENKDRTPVGQDVITMCTKCKLELDHVVVFHNEEGIIENVKCHTCGSEHKYSPDKAESPKKIVKKVTKARKTKKVDPARDFDTLTEKFKGKDSRQYSMAGSFKVEDVIDHKTFGIGFVINASSLKMEVVFSDKPRLLVCNR
jgi:hypothetical protein